MRKYALLFILFFACLNAFAQQGIVFKMKYLPGLAYTSSVNIHTGIEMDFKGDKAELDKITANGTQLPIVLQTKNTVTYTVTTGTPDAKKNFPISIKYLTAENKQVFNGKEIPEDVNSLVGEHINGFCTADGQLKMDTSSGKKAADSLKNKIAEMMNSVEAKIDFPDKPLKKGDSFSQDVPIAVPLAGSTTQVNTHIVYNLIAIQNKIALFDIIQTVNFKTHTPQGDIELTGNGDGKLFYDIEHNNLKVYQTNLAITYTMQMKNLTMSGLAKIFADYQTTIAKH